MFLYNIFSLRENPLALWTDRDIVFMTKIVFWVIQKERRSMAKSFTEREKEKIRKNL